MKSEGRVAVCQTDLLFVYGTLRSGCRNHGVLKRLHGRFLAEGHVQGSLYDLGEFPGACMDESADAKVHGEIYHLPNPRRALKVLDKFEEFDPERRESSQFLRATTQVTLMGGRRLPAWIYWFREVRGKRRRLASGEYQGPGA